VRSGCRPPHDDEVASRQHLLDIEVKIRKCARVHEEELPGGVTPTRVFWGIVSLSMVEFHQGQALQFN